MNKSTVKVIREIIIIFAVLALAILLAFYLRPSKPNLKNDISIAPVDNQPVGDATLKGHRLKLFPEDDVAIVASAFGRDISQGEVNQEANRIFRRYRIDPEGEVARNESFRSKLMVEGLAEILSELLIIEKAPALGLNVKEVVDKAMAEWAEGYESPEAKLASISDNQGVTIERMRKMYIKQFLPPLIQSALTKDLVGISPEKKDKIFADWLINGLKEIDIGFKDENFKRTWNDYINRLEDINKGAGESVPSENEGR